MTEEIKEEIADAEKAKIELEQVREIYGAIKADVYGRMQEIKGDNDLQMQLLLALKLEQYFSKVSAELTVKCKTRLMILGVSKTGAEKRVTRMHETAQKIPV